MSTVRRIYQGGMALLPFENLLRQQEILECHLSLVALREGIGCRDHLARLARVLILANEMCGKGFWKDALPVLVAGQDAILAVQAVGEAGQGWSAQADVLWRPLGALIELYDTQLEYVPRHHVVKAFDAMGVPMPRAELPLAA
ncbi:hypothetical protein [Paraburkholderia sp. A3RO-2L]|uniref:hypothetical protein n=1 Tax=unclassified Paraburkholderia TaxID=2615204 RepID=UPI003DA9AC07